MDKLKLLMSKCKCGVYLTINQHKDDYRSVAQFLDDVDSLDHGDEIGSAIREMMAATDTTIELQFYPDTPIGFYIIYHYDLDLALDEALACIEKETSDAPA
jgi:hypothetical protein